MHIAFPPVTPTSFTWFDGLAVGLLFLFAWNGYRRGLLYFLAGIGATIFAFAISFLFAPLAPVLLPPAHGWDGVVEQRVAFAVLLIASRLVLGLVFRELILALRPILRLVPPLGFADHVFGMVPSLAIGILAVIVLLVLSLVLPLDRRIHEAAANSYVARAIEGELSAGLGLLPKGGFLGDPTRLADALHGLPSVAQTAAHR